MDQRQKNDLDNHITGHYGEDQFKNESLEDISIPIDSIIVEGRVRRDMGNIDELCNSIREVGLIQPIVIGRDSRLMAGERRLRALQRIGLSLLIHGKTFIYNDEEDEVRRKAIECEENLRRKQFTWQEEVSAKKRLYDLMQQIHGASTSGRPSTAKFLGVVSGGFGVNKLSNLLGESNAQTSKDLELARYIEAVPELAKAETKEAARKQIQLGTVVALALAQAKANPRPEGEKKWTLFEGDFVNNVNNLANESIDLVIVDPPYGADTSGMGPNSKQLLASPFADAEFDVVKLFTRLAQESYRVLKPDRFAVFFFDFANYFALRQALYYDHFTVDIPLIWVKNTVVNTSPYSRYGRSYEPILVCRKGEPKLIRPSQRDVIDLQNVIAGGTQEQKFYHAQKPVALIEKFILDMTPPGSTIADFCAGSGTTGIAALNQKRRVFLFEKDSSACQIIRTRLEAL